MASYVHNMGIKYIVDIGSRLDGFIAHILPFCEVNFVDIRPLHVVTGNLKFIHGSITDLPFESDSVASVSSLHVIEHIGLGRYGDSVDTEGHVKAALEMQRVLQPGGVLLLGTVVGKERLCFDAHRIFDPDTIAAMFCGLNLEKFCLIDDEGKLVIEDATFASARSCNYGCGIFIFRKQPNSQNGKLNHGTYI
ncbi:MAG: DUF268 domain-containing protein [Geobacteraceae bacterium]|nr:DUF268 domain-containing protein [Geobacteraceae bacterium]